MEINDGGPAFPRQPGGNGMSLRDYFAAMALNGVLQKYGTTQMFGKITYKLVAAQSYAAADNMITIRQLSPPPAIY